MTTYYADSSALVKRYVTEAGSEAVKTLCGASDNVVAIASIGLVEIAAALGIKVRQNLLSEAVRDGLLRDLHRDGRDQYWLTEVNQEVIAEAIQLTRHYKLRGYDAVHLASALFLSRALLREGLTAPILLSADRELSEAAKAEGLRVENPNPSLS